MKMFFKIIKIERKITDLKIENNKPYANFGIRNKNDRLSSYNFECPPMVFS